MTKDEALKILDEASRELSGPRGSRIAYEDDADLGPALPRKPSRTTLKSLRGTPMWLRMITGIQDPKRSLPSAVEGYIETGEQIQDKILTPLADDIIDLAHSGKWKGPLGMQAAGVKPMPVGTMLHREHDPEMPLIRAFGAKSDLSTLPQGKVDAFMRGIKMGNLGTSDIIRDPTTFTALGGAVGRTALKHGSKQFIKQLVKSEAAMLPRGAKKVLPEFLKAYGEAGAAINPVHAYQLARDAGRSLWTRTFEGMEQVVWKTTPKQVREMLKMNLATTPAKFGEGYAQGLRAIYAQRELAAMDILTTADELKGLSDDAAREATRYLSPRVAGTTATKPTLLNEKQVGILDNFKTEIQGLLDESVEHGIITPAVRDEYINGWLPRLFREKGFRQSGVFRKPIRLTDIHYRKDAYGAIVDLDGGTAEAKQLMKGIGGPEGPKTPSQLKQMADDATGTTPSRLREAFEPTEIIRDELGDVVTTKKGKRVLVKFGSAAERDEFITRYQQAYGKKPIIGAGKGDKVTGLRPGNVVEAPDRKNFGKIVSVDEDAQIATVRFVNPETKATATKRFPLGELKARGRTVSAKRKPPTGKTEVFDPLSEDELAALDEIVDPRQNLYNALSTMRTNIAKSKFFKTIADDPNLATTAVGADHAGWKSFGQTRRLGALSGKTVRPDVYREIQGLMQMYGPWRKAWNFLLSEWKAGKTLWEVRTQFRNLLGNAVHGYFADNLPPFVGGVHNTPHWIEGALAHGKKHPLHRELIEEGIIGVAFPEQELGMIAGTMSKTPLVAEAQAKTLMNVLKRTAKELTLTQSTAGRALGKLYSFGDSWARSSTYIKARNAWGMSRKEAASHVNRYFQNYEQVGDLVKRLSMSPIGTPFSRFTAEAARIHYNAAKHRPLKLAIAYGLLPYGVWEAAKASNGMTEEEVKGIQERGKLVLPIPFHRDENGNVETIDLSYIFPAGQIVNAWMGNKYNRDDPFVRQWVDRLGNFVFGNPVFTGFAGLATGVDLFRGYEFRERGERQSEADWRFFLQQLAPGSLHPATHIPLGAKEHTVTLPDGTKKTYPLPRPSLGRTATKLKYAREGRNYRTGERRKALDVVLDAVFGLAKIPFNPNVEKDKAKRHKGAVEMQGKRAESKVKREDKTGFLLPGEKAGLKARIREITKEEVKGPEVRRLRAMIEAMRRAGVTAKELERFEKKLTELESKKKSGE